MTIAPRRFGRVNWLGLATLFRRELARYLKEAWETVLAPAFSTLVYLAVFAVALGTPPPGTADGAVLAFIIPGLVMLTVIYRAAETTSFSLVFDKLEGIIGDLLAAPLSPAEMTAAYALAGMIAGIATGTVTLLATLPFHAVLPVQPWALAAFALLGALMLSLTGILIGLASQKWDHLAGAFVFLLVPLTFLSGLFAPVDALPAPFDTLIRLNPIFHAIDGFRYGWLGFSDQPPARALAVLAGTCALLWLLAGRLIAVGWRLRP